MQVLENAVRKLKATSHAESASTRVEPSFENSAGGQPTPFPTPPVRATVPPPPARRPLFSDLPDPELEEGDHSTELGGGGGGSGGTDNSDNDEDRKFGPWLTWLGAAASIALVIMVGLWTYKLGQRDAMEVPIVAALEGPARVVPDDRGGLSVSHQGHSVNTILDGNGVEAVADQVKTAPQDDQLTEDDVSQGALTALVASQTPAARPLASEDAETTGQGTSALADSTQIEPLTPNGAIVTTPAAEIAAQEQGTETVASVKEVDAPETSPARVEDTVVAAVDPATATVDPATSSVPSETVDLEVAALGPLPPLGEGSVYAPAMMRSPQARPQSLNTAMEVAVNAALETVLAEAPVTPSEGQVAAEPVVVAANSLDTIPLPAGTRMIQLGAYGSEAIARQQWERLSSQHSDLLGSKQYFVQRTDNSGKVFYRLRVAGYETKADTRAACASLSARGLPCITVTLP